MRRNADWILLGSLGLSLLGLAQPASAQSCTVDGDCAEGLVCKSFGEICTDIACVEGQECPSQCEEYRECSLPDCTQNSDCPENFVCAEATYEECSGEVPVDCAEGSECPKPVPAECTEVTEHYCEARYNLPCTVDADCGTGFSCVEQESCACSGSAGASDAFAPPADGGAAPPPEEQPAEETCDCTPSGTFFCELIEVACESDSDCTGDFSCQDNPNRPVCSDARPAAPPSGSGEQDGGTADQPLPAPDCGVDASIPAKVCLPPYWNVGGVGIARGEAASSGAVDDLATAGPAGSGAPSQNSSGGDPSEEGDGDGASTSSSCSVGAPGASSSALPWLSLLALAALRRRRS